MKFIIPAKTNSTRIPDKNWREFSGGKSLVQICVEKLLPLGEVWVSCEDENKIPEALKMGARLHERRYSLTENNCSFREWITETVRQCQAEDEPIGWCQVTSPLFNEYADMIAQWESSAGFERFDSMVAVYPKKEYLLDSMFRPVGWGWGPWHTTGQKLPCMYQMPWVFSILTPESIRETGYHIGARPRWYIAKSPAVDIDDWGDWEYAKWKYERRNYGCSQGAQTKQAEADLQHVRPVSD